VFYESFVSLASYPGVDGSLLSFGDTAVGSLVLPSINDGTAILIKDIFDQIPSEQMQDIQVRFDISAHSVWPSEELEASAIRSEIEQLTQRLSEISLGLQ